jgi:hypothetical protein
MAPVAYGTYL